MISVVFCVIDADIFVFQYKATDFVVPGAGRLEMKFIPEKGEEIHHTVFEFKDGGGVALGMYNTDKVILIHKITHFLWNSFENFPPLVFQFFVVHSHFYSTSMAKSDGQPKQIVTLNFKYFHHLKSMTQLHCKLFSRKISQAHVLLLCCLKT